MTRSYFVVALLMLLILMGAGVRPVVSQGDIEEYMDVYVIGKYAYAELEIRNYEVLGESLRSVLDTEDLAGVEIGMFFVRSWDDAYLYFLELNTSFNEYFEFPTTYVYISMDNPGLASTLMPRLERIFMTKLVLVGDRYVGYADRNIMLSFFQNLLEKGNYTPFLEWLDPSALALSADAVGMVIIVGDDGSTTYREFVFRTVALSENTWRLSGLLSTAAPYRETEGVSSYLRLSILKTYVADVPENVSYTYDPESDTYVLDIGDATAIKNPTAFRINMFVSTPILLLHRSFNVTNFSAGTIVEVILNASIPSFGSTLVNISISEPSWWSGIGALIDGEPNITIDALGPGGSELIRYVVNITSTEESVVNIPPAVATLEFLGGKTVSIRSNSNVIHLNREAPIIDMWLEISGDSNLNLGGRINYIARISNRGEAPASNVIFAGFVLGTLDPGEDVRINESLVLFGEGEIVKKLVVEAEYVFDSERFNVSSMAIEYQPELTAYRVAIINVEMSQKKVNDTLATYEISIRNDGPEPISNLKVLLRMFGGQLVNVSEDYILEDVYYVFTPEIIGPEEIYTVTLNVTYPESVISLAPQARVVLGDVLLYVTELNYFENVLSFDVRGYREFIIKDRSYTFDIVVSNMGPIPVFNLSMAWSELVEDASLLPDEYAAAEVPPTSEEVVTVNLTVSTTGDIELPAARFTYTFLGKNQFSNVELAPVKVFNGIEVTVAEPEVVLGSGEEGVVKLVLEIDNSSVYSDLRLRVDLPEGLELVNKTVDGYIVVGDVPRSVAIAVKGLRPGIYRVGEVEYVYNFVDEEVSEVAELDLSIRVREDLIGTYLVWLVPALLMGIAFGILTRKRISG